jgi:putative ABC transport system permease protein
VTALIAMLSIGEGAKREALRQIERLGLNNVIVKALPLTRAQEIKARERLSGGLDFDDAARLKSALPSAAAAALREVAAEIMGASPGASYQVAAVSPEYGRVKDLSVARGRFLCDQDELRRNLVCVLGAEIAPALGVQGHPGSTLRLGDSVFTVAGVLETRHWSRPKLPALASRNYNRSVLIPLSAARLFRRDPPGALPVDEISIRFPGPREVVPGAGVIANILSRRHHGVEDYQVVIPQELIREARETQKIFNFVLGGIAGISLLVGGIGIMNIMLAAVSERTREIGIRRAVGASRKHIAAQFLAEAVVLTVSGGVLGTVIGCLVSALIAVLAGWSTVVTGWSVALSIAMALSVGIFFGFYPARRAARLDPIEALRHE